MSRSAKYKMLIREIITSEFSDLHKSNLIKNDIDNITRMVIRIIELMGLDDKHERHMDS